MNCRPSTQPTRLRTRRRPSSWWTLCVALCGFVLLYATFGRCGEDVPAPGRIDNSTDRADEIESADHPQENIADAEPLLLRAREEYAGGKLRRALDSVQSARRHDPRSTAAFRMEIQIRRDLGDRAGYAQTLHEMAACHLDSARLQNEAGRLLVHAGDFERGLPLLERAVDLAPERSQYARDLAAAYVSNRQADAAREVLLDAWRRAPNDRDLPLVLARFFDSEGQWKEAARYYQMAVAADGPTSHWRKQAARCLYESGDYERAVEHFEEFAVGSCGELTLAEHIQYGDACLRLGCVDVAGVIFDHAAHSAPGPWKEVELLRCICRLKAGEEQQARELIDAALVHWPGDETLTRMIELCDGADPE